MKLEEKKSIVDDLHHRLEKAAVVILTDYKGLDVASLNDLRKKLRGARIQYQVAKNTLLERASQETGMALLKEYFKGPSAIALSYDDPVAPAKVLTDFAKEHKALEIKAGVMNGKLLDFDAVKRLADLPSREVLFSQVLSAMNAVPTGFVRALNAIPGQLLNVLQAIKDQKEAA